MYIMMKVQKGGQATKPMMAVYHLKNNLQNFLALVDIR